LNKKDSFFKYIFKPIAEKISLKKKVLLQKIFLKLETLLRWEHFQSFICFPLEVIYFSKFIEIFFSNKQTFRDKQFVKREGVGILLQQNIYPL